MKVLIVYHTTYGHTLQSREQSRLASNPSLESKLYSAARPNSHVEKKLEAGDGYATKIWKDQKRDPALYPR